MADLIPIPHRDLPPDPGDPMSHALQGLEAERAEVLLRELAAGMRPQDQETSLRTLVRHLGKTLPATWVFLLEAADPEAKVLRTVAGWGPNGFHDGLEVESEGTVFERFLEKDLTVAMWSGSRGLVPKPLSRDLIRGMGFGLFDARENLLGSLVILSDQPISLDGPLESALRIYAAHAAAELDRSRTVKALQQEIQQRYDVEEDLNVSHRDLRDLAHHLQSIQEEERERIAAQIHDELGQVLTALKIDIAWIRGHLDNPDWKIEERFRSIGELINTTVATVRHIAAELRPRILDELGLVSAIEWQIKDHLHRSNFSCRFLCNPPEISVEPDLATAVFRSFQELMNNVVRHADARKVEVRLERQEGSLELSVKDDGRGLKDLDFRSDDSFGLLQIQERAKYWGGTMSIESSAGAGTEVTLHLPLESL